MRDGEEVGETDRFWVQPVVSRRDFLPTSGCLVCACGNILMSVEHNLPKPSLCNQLRGKLVECMCMCVFVVLASLCRVGMYFPFPKKPTCLMSEHLHFQTWTQHQHMGVRMGEGTLRGRVRVVSRLTAFSALLPSLHPRRRAPRPAPPGLPRSPSSTGWRPKGTPPTEGTTQHSR